MQKVHANPAEKQAAYRERKRQERIRHAVNVKAIADRSPNLTDEERAELVAAAMWMLDNPPA